jgi:hypothetical protein
MAAAICYLASHMTAPNTLVSAAAFAMRAICSALDRHPLFQTQREMQRGIESRDNRQSQCA